MTFQSRTVVAGVAAQQVYSFTFQVVVAAEVAVAVDGVAVAASEVTTDAAAGTVTLTTTGHTFVGGEVVTIHRSTPRPDASRYVDPQDAGALSETALDTLQLQLLHAAQELWDALGEDDMLGPQGGLLTWTGAGVPPTVLPAGALGQTLTIAPDGTLGWIADGGGAGGEPNTQSDGGATGQGLTLPKVGFDLPLRRIRADANITLDATVAGELGISAPVSGGQTNDGSNVGAGTLSHYQGKTGSTLDFKTLAATAPLTAAPGGAGVENAMGLDQNAVRLSTGAQAGFMSAADFLKLAGIAPNADQTNATNVDAAGAVMETDYGSSFTVLAAQTNTNIPVLVGVPTDTVLGKVGSGLIKGVTKTEQRNNIIDYVEKRAFNVSTPAAGAAEPAFFTDRNITVTKLRAVNIGTAPSVTWNVRHHTNRNDAGNQVLAADKVTTSITAGDEVTGGFADATIPANSWVWLDITAVAGTATLFHLELEATID